ncbi:DUF397 domain-containing protein [Streptomyces sp. NRRL F-2890]|uniref:DUF397 domain-containing protein n=1 Tax=Streptomyces sp. NRRL F-2890 TaxID=1463845 RepID=UPI0004C73DEE|nr:DUF397 domain-containing protein [Streptomyces sp. NRRL F-2890]
MSEVDLTTVAWFTSSYSNGQSSCVEAAFVGHRVAARDTKHEGSGPVLIVGANAWAAFAAAVAGRAL